MSAGSIDLLGFDPTTRTLLVVEIKTVIADIQGLLRPLDVKVRLARDVARDLSWEGRDVVPALVVAEDSTARRRVAEHAALFSRFSVRGWAAHRWLGARDGSPDGLLLFVDQSGGTGGALSRPGRQRVRQRGRTSRSDGGQSTTPLAQEAG